MNRKEHAQHKIQHIIYVFSFRSELEFVELVNGKSDHQ